MAKGFSAQLREEAGAIWHRIFHHPFIKELQQGTLPIEKFRYYLIQDYMYLEGFARAVALALAKAPNAETLESLSKRVSMPIERPLHRKLMSLTQISEKDLERNAPSPTNLAYINHLIKVASLSTLCATAAALLPCPWAYHELGGVLGEVDHPVYGAWTSFYVEGWMKDSVNAWRHFVDQEALQGSRKELETMREAFLTSSRYEFLFWEMAYKQESWPV